MKFVHGHYYQSRDGNCIHKWDKDRSPNSYNENGEFFYRAGPSEYFYGDGNWDLVKEVIVTDAPVPIIKVGWFIAQNDKHSWYLHERTPYKTEQEARETMKVVQNMFPLASFNVIQLEVHFDAVPHSRQG